MSSNTLEQQITELSVEISNVQNTLCSLQNKMINLLRNKLSNVIEPLNVIDNVIYNDEAKTTQTETNVSDIAKTTHTELNASDEVLNYQKNIIRDLKDDIFFEKYHPSLQEVKEITNVDIDQHADPNELVHEFQVETVADRVDVDEAKDFLQKYSKYPTYPTVITEDNEENLRKFHESTLEHRGDIVPYDIGEIREDDIVTDDAIIRKSFSDDIYIPKVKTTVVSNCDATTSDSNVITEDSVVTD